MTLWIAIAALAIQGQTPPAAAPALPDVRWEKVYEGPRGILSVDPDSIETSGDVVRMRRRTEYRETGADGMRSLVLVVAVKCAARTYSILSIAGYREDGSLIRSVEVFPGDQQARDRAFPPDDEADALYGRSCPGAAR